MAYVSKKDYIRIVESVKNGNRRFRRNSYSGNRRFRRSYRKSW